MLYLHAGGHLHGKVASIPSHLRMYEVPIPIPTSFTVFQYDNIDAVPIEIKTATYERVDTVLFGRSLSVYVARGSGDKAALIFDVVTSSAVKAVMDEPLA